MQEDWAEKYRPRSLEDVAGNPKALAELRKWADAWQAGNPKKKGAILAGKPGTGKTSTALALANDLNWGVIELNASDVRSADAITRTAFAGSVSEMFTADGQFLSSRSGHRKLIIFDEADNLYERAKKGSASSAAGKSKNKEFSDRGGKKAIRNLLKHSIQPIILIVNDLYALTRGGGFTPHCVTIKFQKVSRPAMRRALSRICSVEDVSLGPEVLDAVVDAADGDMRSALNDLQSMAQGETTVEEVNRSIVGRRDTKITAMDAVRKILKSEDVMDARRASWELEETPNNLLTWLDENIPREFKRPEELAAAYDRASRADVFLGRVMRRQNYRLWAYASDLMTAGMVVSREGRPYRGFTPYQFPRYMARMGQSRGRRAVRESLSLKIGRACHCSANDVKAHLMEDLRSIIHNQGEAGSLAFICKMSVSLRLEESEIEALAADALQPELIGLVIETVERIRETPEDRRSSIAFDVESLLKERELAVERAKEEKKRAAAEKRKKTAEARKAKKQREKEKKERSAVQVVEKPVKEDVVEAVDEEKEIVPDENQKSLEQWF